MSLIVKDNFIEIKEGNLTIISFPFNQSGNNTLYSPNITIEKQTGNDFGSLLIKGITLEENQTKSVLVDNLNPSVNTICGLSNISFGLPERGLINRNFLALCLAYGLSAAILDPTDKQLMATLLTVEMLLGQDEYCGNFIDAFQNGRILG